MISFSDKLILAPLTKGGNLPFRRLCTEFGADITISEMAYARFVVKGEGREKALLRSHPSEKCFGVQFAVIDPKEALAASKIAIEYGAQFIDINCGCPIDDTTRRGLGASVLRKPNHLIKLVEALSQELPIPLTVKIRLGWSEKEINALALAERIAAAGANALIVHGRTREQRYSKSADWNAIAEIKNKISIPVIGNGDILTHFEAEDRKAMSGVDSLLIARGALIKPWLFQEIKEGRTLNLTAPERAMIFHLLARFMKEHFYSDERGIKRIMQFLPWHFSFFHRYTYLPKERFLEASRVHPLIQSRFECEESDDPLDSVLASPHEAMHVEIAKILLTSDENTVCDHLRSLADQLPQLPDITTQNQERYAAG